MATNNTMAVSIRNMTAELEKAKGKFAAGLPGNMAPSRFVRLALTVFAKTPRLHECDPSSFLGACMQAAQLGLEPGINAHLVPFRTKGGNTACQLILDYRGLIKLALQSGMVGKFVARVVKAGDEFEMAYGLEDRLVHVPRWDSAGEARSSVGFYCVAHFTNPNVKPDFEFMTLEQVEAVRKRSKASGDGPWVTDYDAMALKTVVKRICKRLPQSIELADAVRLDNDAETGTDQRNATLIIPPDEYSEKVDIDPETGEVVPPPRSTAEKLAEKAKEGK